MATLVAVVFGLLLVASVIYIASLLQDRRYLQAAVKDLTQRVTSRQHSVMVRRDGSSKAVIEKARTTRRDSTDLPATGRQHRIKRTEKGGESA